MKINRNDNQTEVFEIIKTAYKTELNSELKRYENEVYFTALDENNIICGVSRFCKLSQVELLREGFEIFNLKQELANNKDIYYLSGIWVKQTHRKQGVGKKLLKSRLQMLKNSVIITDVRKSSDLLNIYTTEYGFKIIEEETEYIILKKF